MRVFMPGAILVGMGQAVGHRMIVIPEGEIDVPLAIIEGCNCIGIEYCLQRCWRIDADPVKRHACTFSADV